MNVYILSLFLLHNLGQMICYQMIPDRANVTYYNPKYAYDPKIYIKRYGRKSPYYINVEGANKHLWNNNVTFNFYFYEYLHNEYRRSFVEIHFKFCDMLSTDPYIGGMLKAHGIKCPLQIEHHYLPNMTVPLASFPHLWPFEKAKIEADFTATDTGDIILKGYMTCLFKKEIKKNLPKGG